MAKNTDGDEERMKTPDEDAQGHCDPSLSSTEILVEPNNRDIIDKIPELKKKKKKKCRGDRKAQHRRRRLRRQQRKVNEKQTLPMEPNAVCLQDDSNEEQIQENPSHAPKRVTSKNKRKRQGINQNGTHVNRSLSQLSISHESSTKKKKIPITTDSMTTTIDSPSVNVLSNEVTDENQTEMDLGNDNKLLLPTKRIQQFKPHYLTLSDEIFKQMLSNAVQDGDTLVQCLNTDEKLQAVRQMTEETNNLHYFDLQQHLWQTYYNIGITEKLWVSSATDSSTSEAYPTYYFPKGLVEKRQQTVIWQKQRTINELQQCMIYLQQNTPLWEPLIDLDLLLRIVTECVKNGQHRLRQEFFYRIDITQLDLDERRSKKAFYDLQPNQEQIRLAKRYWQVIANEQRTTEEIEKLRKRIYLRRLPHKIDKIIEHSIDHVQPMLLNSVLDEDRRAGLKSNYSKMIAQYKFNLMTLNLDTMEMIRRGHRRLLVDLQENVSQLCTDALQKAIRNHQQTMEKRHKKFLEHTLSPFFDEASTASDG